MEIQNNTTPIIISWSASGSKNYSQLTDKSAASGSIIFSAQDKCIYANGVKFALSESEVQTLINNSISGLNVDNEIKAKCAECSAASNAVGLCLSCNDGYRKVNHTLYHPEFLDCLKESDPLLKKYFCLPTK